MAQSGKGLFSWTTFYMEFADRLLLYKHRRQELLQLLEEIYDEQQMRLPFTDQGEVIDDICPFTVMGAFNKGITHENRMALAKKIGDKIGVTTDVPDEFAGIPLLNNQKSWFFAYRAERQDDDITNLWAVFEAALQYADEPSELHQTAFIDAFNKVRTQRGVKWNLTMGLFWIRPFFFLNLDRRNRDFILDANCPYAHDVLTITQLRDLPTGDDYVRLIQYFHRQFKQDDCKHQHFPQLSHEAWIAQTDEQDEPNKPDEPYGEPPSEPPPESPPTEPHPPSQHPPVPKGPIKRERKYWIYSPGHGASKWDEFYEKGIMGIGWDELGDLTEYPSKDAMKKRMKQLYGEEFTYRNAGHATWQFANDIQPGDIVFAKKGNSRVIGRGVVGSSYQFDPDRSHYKHIRKVKWLQKGDWEHPGQAANKTLTDITPYHDYVRKLEDIFINDDDEEELEVSYETYTKADFLNEVFLDEDRYDTLVNLLKMKHNIILQGAPGVGKTFAAKRLAFSMMGEKDTERIMMVQFHQSYSYEDFIMGYRPTESGFELARGPFYEFCKKAEEDDERAYFFIIDEINRGNLSKIFGELLMLIEKDKRGEQLRLLYNDEDFSIPKNVYLIGMMNTADRSLALIDYALRRRFAFFEMVPAFDSAGFQAYLNQVNHPRLTALVQQIKALNEEITLDDSLGRGFRIGHSFLYKEDGVSDDWLTAVIEYELIPLLDEYWFDEPDKVTHWAEVLRGVFYDSN